MIVAALDFETTSADPLTARIVTAAIVLIDDHGTETTSAEWLVDPGIPIPEEATAIHGITTDQARHAGAEPAAVLMDLALVLQSWADHPLAVYNAPFDLTILDREIRRHEVFDRGINSLRGRPILDPLVLDKHVWTYRKGSRKLVDVAAVHGVAFDGPAHGAHADALAAARLAQHLVDQPAFAAAHGNMWTLHDAQVGWARQQADSLADYFHRTGQHDRADTVRGSWPYIPEETNR